MLLIPMSSNPSFKTSESHGRPIPWKHMYQFPTEIELEICPVMVGFNHPLYPVRHYCYLNYSPQRFFPYSSQTLLQDYCLQLISSQFYNHEIFHILIRKELPLPPSYYIVQREKSHSCFCSSYTTNTKFCSLRKKIIKLLLNSTKFSVAL